jgi:hypothetical protein
VQQHQRQKMVETVGQAESAAMTADNRKNSFSTFRLASELMAAAVKRSFPEH